MTGTLVVRNECFGSVSQSMHQNQNTHKKKCLTCKLQRFLHARSAAVAQSSIRQLVLHAVTATFPPLHSCTLAARATAACTLAQLLAACAASATCTSASAAAAGQRAPRRINSRPRARGARTPHNN